MTEQPVSLTRYEDDMKDSFYRTAYDVRVNGHITGRVFQRLGGRRGWDAIADTGAPRWNVWVARQAGTRKAAVAAVVAAQS